MLGALFGARTQVAMGVALFAATIAQTIYWETGGRRPGYQAIFLVSMEALAFAAYGIIATGLGYRATERVEAHVEAEVSIDES